MGRKHLVTHPILGVVDWATIKKTAAEISKSTDKRVCSWCHKEVPKGNRTRCGKPSCSEAIWRATSWDRCRKVCLRENKICAICGFDRSSEVDHIIPVVLGGTGDKENLRALCHKCHLQETNRLRKSKDGYVANHAPDKLNGVNVLSQTPSL